MAAEGIGGSDIQSTNNCIASSSPAGTAASQAQIATPKETQSLARVVSPGMFSPGANTFPVPGFRFGYASPGGPGLPTTQGSSQVSSNNPAALVRKIVSEAQYQMVNAQNIVQVDNIFHQVLSDLNCDYRAVTSEQAKEALLADIKQVFATYVVALIEVSNDKNRSEAAAAAFDMLNSIMENPYFDPAIKDALLGRVFEYPELTDLLLSSLPSDAQVGFDELVYKDGNFKNLPLETRFALLSRISNYPNKDVIVTLKRLVDKPDFSTLSLDDQKQLAMVIAVLSAYDGDRTILNNTVEVILRSRGLKIDWDYSTRHGGEYKHSDHDITFSRMFVKANYNKVQLTSKAARYIVFVAVHEVNHERTGRSKGGDGSYGNLMDEYRAYCVAFKAINKREPNEQEGYDVLHDIIFDKENYENIWLKLRDENSPDSIRMRAFIGQAIKINNPTVADIDKFDQDFQKHRSILSANKLAIPPEAVDGGSNNLDNHL